LSDRSRLLVQHFQWVSSFANDFNHDFGVGFTPQERACGEVRHNYRMQPFPHEEAPGLSVFCRDDAGLLRATATSGPIDARAGHADIARWFFLMVTTHAAGLTLLSARVSLCLADSPAGEITASGSPMPATIGVKRAM